MKNNKLKQAFAIICFLVGISGLLLGGFKTVSSGMHIVAGGPNAKAELRAKMEEEAANKSTLMKQVWIKVPVVELGVLKGIGAGIHWNLKIYYIVCIVLTVIGSIMPWPEWFKHLMDWCSENIGRVISGMFTSSKK
jgi:hypothetical protein